MPGLTLDAGALIALDKSDRKIIALLARAYERQAAIVVPASALAQATRSPRRQARLSRLVRQPETNVVALDRVDAVRVGRLLAASQSADVVDAHVALCAQRTQTSVVTSDVDDLRRLDPELTLIEI